MLSNIAMNEEVTTFNSPANTSAWRSIPSAEPFRALRNRFRLFAHIAGVILCGCFFLVILFALQVAVLELSDRLNIFPLYSFFSINLLCGLFLIWLIVKSRNFSSLSNQVVVPTTLVKLRRLRRLWAGILGVLNISKAKAPTHKTAKPVAVLLIIKREAIVESKQKSHAASA